MNPRSTKYYYLGITRDMNIVCKIYVLSNELCIAICRSRFAKYGIPYYLAIGYEPSRGECAKEEWGFKTVEEADKHLKEIFAKGKPEIWINNTRTISMDSDFNELHDIYSRTFWKEFIEAIEARNNELRKIDITRPLTKEDLKKIGEILKGN